MKTPSHTFLNSFSSNRNSGEVPLLDNDDFDDMDDFPHSGRTGKTMY